LTPTDLRNKLEVCRKGLRANLEKKRKIDRDLVSRNVVFREGLVRDEA
jgi:hypothetical protein